jgi:hypothetical protein
VISATRYGWFAQRSICGAINQVLLVENVNYCMALKNNS